MPNFKIIENNLLVNKNKYTIKCGKCSFDFQSNHTFFCYYHCISCQKKMVNPKHIDYHVGRKKCFYETLHGSDIDNELDERNKTA